ncbi:MAG: LytTR family DNA-binding domain-containing protein [Saccharofermentanales bacterium]
MKIEIKVLPETEEPYAVIYTSEITPEVRRAAELLNMESSGVISVVENERIIVLRPDEIYMVRVENEKTVVYTKAKQYSSGKRLYEFEEILGDGFMRISKSTLANLHYLDYVEPTLGGLMLVVLKNGCKDYISRKYLPSFKKYLGL